MDVKEDFTPISAVTEQTPSPELTEELCHSVFSNRVITTEILSHLTFPDLKALRVVSRHFLENVEAYERFKDSQLLPVTRDRISLLDYLCELEPDFHQDRNLMHVTWLDIRNIQIDVYFVEQNLLHIPRYILKNVSFLSLLSKDLENDDDENQPAPVMPMYRILSSTEQISHLQLDLRLLMVDLNDIFHSFSFIRDNLKNVKHLDIFGWPRKRFGSTTYWIDDEYLPNFTKNLTHLAEVFQRLERLHLPVFILSQNQEPKIQPVVETLLQQSRENLRELSIHLGMWDKLVPVSLPHLNNLSATVSIDREQDSLRNFLAKNNNSLLELDVAVRRHYDFGSNLFDVIRQRSPYLKKLHLQAYKFGDEDGNEVKVDWTFLREMKVLRDFQLARPYVPVRPNWEFYGNGPLLLESLPRNQLERLSLRGIGTKAAGFWRNDLSDNEPELPFKVDLLVRGFRNLKRLSLRYCPDAVDDEIMRVIIRDMTSLEEFEVSHCSGLSDAGIAGTSEDGSDSIRNLKCLKMLSIRACPLVTPACILSCLHFPFLRRFDYIDAEKLCSPFVKKIMSQNPSLKSVAVNFETDDDSMLKSFHEQPFPVTLINLSDWECGNDSDSDAELSDTEDNEDSDDDDEEA